MEALRRNLITARIHHKSMISSVSQVVKNSTEALFEITHLLPASNDCTHGLKTRPSPRQVGRVVSVSARSETSPSHKSIDSTQRRPTRPRIGVDSVDSAESAATRPSRLRFSAESARNVYSPVMNGYKGKSKKKKKKLTSLSLRSGDHRSIIAAQIWTPPPPDRHRPLLPSPR